MIHIHAGTLADGTHYSLWIDRNRPWFMPRRCWFYFPDGQQPTWGYSWTLAGARRRVNRVHTQRTHLTGRRFIR